VQLNVEILDDFLPDPEAFRQEALKSPFYDIRGPDGVNYKNICVRPSDEFEALFSERLKAKVKVGYSLLRRNFEGEMPNNAVHSDNSYDEYAAVLYLNQPEDCQGGTAFWKWKELDTAEWPPEDFIRRRGKKPSRIYERLLADHNRAEAWELLHVGEMKFNRVVCFPTKVFHSRWPFAAFGTTPETARTIVATFFSFKK
jgi:hypothetical protein